MNYVLMLRGLLLGALAFVSLNTQAYQVGDTVDPDQLKALKIDNQQITLVDFFASWCTSCKKELPELNSLRSELAAQQVAVIGIDTDKEVEKGIAFQQKLGLQFPITNDAEQQIVRRFQPMGMPALFYLYQGKVVQLRLGAMPHISDQIRRDIHALRQP